MGLAPALHCEILLVIYQRSDMHMEGDRLHGRCSFTVLFFSLSFVGAFPLLKQLCRSRKINLLMYFLGGLDIM